MDIISRMTETVVSIIKKDDFLLKYEMFFDWNNTFNFGNCYRFGKKRF